MVVAAPAGLAQRGRLRCESMRLVLIISVALVSGCRHETAPEKKEPAAPTVQVVRPEMRTIDVTIEQPAFVNAFEQTALFAKVSGFIDDYYFDIGDEVKNGQLLAKIFVPELKERHDQMVEQVKLDTQLVDVAQKGVQNAEAEVAEAKAKLCSYDAEIDRWGTEVKRLTEMVREKVV